MQPRSLGTAALLASIAPNLAFASPTADEQPAAQPEDAQPEEAPPERETKQGLPDDRLDRPWIKRWAPEPNMGEIGIYGGILMPSDHHELFAPDLSVPNQGWKQLAKVAPDVGLRFGYYPSRFVGIELEGGVMPTRLRDSPDPALLYTFRGQLVLQLGLWSVTPFLLVGGGGLGVASPADVLGDDLDPALHYGGGLKFYLNRWVMLRLDVRDVVSHKQGVSNVFNAHNLEVLLGLSITLGREREEAEPEPEPEPVESDRDGDGIPDSVDDCPDDPETVNGYLDDDGCPEFDSDADGFWDEQDACPADAETVNGYLDDDGCPEFDSDGDGFWDEQDACPNEPETVNGYADQDGCPDELPEEVRAFTGVIEGINFETGSDVIRKSSEPKLDKAVEVLNAHPDIRIRIIGHTDSRGEREKNIDLSQRRAASVKNYLVEHGVDEGRIQTEGKGPDEPIDDNKTKSGRANNRRIEFEIVH